MLFLLRHLLEATKGEIRNFILKDYGAANYEALGGMEGVKALQKTLGVKEDGYFGPDTFKALIEYQKANGLETDAIAGSKTQTKMGIKIGSNAPERKEQERKTGWTPAIPSLETVPATQTIRRFSILTGAIEEQIKSINDYKKENTGVVGGVGDAISNGIRFFGGSGYETGRDIYERQIKQAQERAKELHSQILGEFQGKTLSPKEQAEVDGLVSKLEKFSGAKLQNVSWGVAVFNTFGMDSKGEANVAKQWAHYVLWLAEGVFDVATGIADLTKFLLKFGFSEEYRSEISKQYDQVMEYLDKNWGVSEVAVKAFKDEVERISRLPPNEMSGAIGKIFGVVIGTIATGWAIGGLSKAKWAASVASETFSSAAKAAQLAGRTEQAAALALSSSREAAKAMAYRIGAFVLNGPAESAIGASLSGSFRIVSTTLRWGASIAHKLKTVEKGIGDFGEAIKREADPEKLKYLQEGKSALEKEKEGLVKQLEHKESPKSPASDEGVSAKSSEKPTKKEFTTEWKESKRILQELSQYYHPDKANHPNAEAIAKELNRLRAEMKAGKDVRAELEAIAKDADAYVESRGLRTAEAAVKTPHEQFVENLRKYSENFSEIRLRALAPKDAEAFGHALLQKQVLADIETLAKTEPERAMAEFNEFMSRPAKYLDKKYPAPYSSPDAEARAYARQAYERAYKNEYAELVDRHREAYENFLKESPNGSKDMAETIRKVSENIESIARMLGERFQDFKAQLQEIAQLLKGNLRENLDAVMARIESFAESVRLDPKMGLDMKARISNVLRDIKSRLSKSGTEAFASVPEAHYQRVAMEKRVAGINIPRSNGSISGVGAGDFHIVGKEGDDILTVHWKEGDVWKSKEIPRKDFEALNPDFAKPKEAWKPRSESGMNENHSERAEPQRKNGVRQAQEYNRNAGESFRERVEDGFADGGRSAKFFDTKEAAEQFAHEKNVNAKNPETRYTVSRLSDGRYGVSSREFIMVDRVNDPILKNMISSMEKLKSIANPTERARAMLRFVYEEGEKLSRIKWDPLENSMNLHGSKYLGEIFANDWAAVCRHRSLLVKILWDELGLETAIRKWYGINPGGKMDPHAWNEIRINGKWYVADTTMVLDNPESLGLYRDMRHLGVLDGNREFVSIHELENARQAA